MFAIGGSAGRSGGRSSGLGGLGSAVTTIGLGAAAGVIVGVARKRAGDPRGEEVRATIAELRASRARLAQAADAERRRIARRLEDGVQQTLVLLAIQSDQLRLSADDPDAVRRASDELRRNLDATLDDVRALSRGIFPALLAERGLRTAVEDLVATAPIPVELEADPADELQAPEHVQSTGYFAISAALADIASHTGATHAIVSLRRDREGALRIDVVDDGIGQASPAWERGIDRVSDRVAAAGGTVAVESWRGGGTRVSITLPCVSGPGIA